jgi:8-oxo-dGTP diphosphatase
VRLHFFRIREWRGEPHPLEDQAISWQRPDAAMAAPMLPANAPVLASLRLPHEYAVTDSRRFGLPAIERRLRAGLHLLQVREPDNPGRDAFTRQVIELAHRHGCKVMTKEPFPGADGVHLTAKALMALRDKPSGLAAASCHTREELERAMALGFDFAVLGSVKGEKGALGWARFAQLARHATLPVYAIGGLSRDDLRDAWRAGAHGVAMIRAAWS